MFEKIQDAIDRAETRYGSTEHIDIILDKESNALELWYCDKHNSFPVELHIADFADIKDKKAFIELLDENDVGYDADLYTICTENTIKKKGV